MSSSVEQNTGRTCIKCGAQQPRETKTCWLCGALTTLDSHKPQATNPVRPASDRFSFSLSTLLLLMALAAVCFGLLAEAPGLGVPMCVLLVPVLVRTAKVVRRREAAGLSVSRAEKISLMATSFGVATVVAVVVAVAAFCSFCGVCLLVMSPGGAPDTLVWGTGMCIVAALAILLFAVMIKWIRRRYRRDISEE